MVLERGDSLFYDFSRFGRLSQRENEIAELLSDQSLSSTDNHVLAKRLGITKRTIKTHLRHIYLKLRLKNKPQLAVMTYFNMQRQVMVGNHLYQNGYLRLLDKALRPELLDEIWLKQLEADFNQG